MSEPRDEDLQQVKRFPNQAIDLLNAFVDKLKDGDPLRCQVSQPLDVPGIGTMEAVMIYLEKDDGQPDTETSLVVLRKPKAKAEDV